MSFSDYLKGLRMNRGFKTQTALADECFLAQGHLSRFESSEQIPNKETIFILCRALDESYLDMLDKAIPQDFLKNEDRQLILQQEKIDIELEKFIIKIYKSIVYDRDLELQEKFLDLIKKELGIFDSEAIKKRLKDYKNWANPNPLSTDSQNRVVQRISKKESVRLFYKLIRKGYIKREEFLKEIKFILNTPQITKKLDLADDKTGDIYVDGVLMTKKERFLADNFIRSYRQAEAMY